VAGLLAAQALVTVISPTLGPDLAVLHAADRIRWLPRAYEPGDLAGAWLVFAATNVREVNAAVAQEAAQRRILCNVADAASEGSFHVPAVYRHEQVVVAVGSSGTEPARAKQVRDRIGRWLEEH
jgi:cobalt-precorrin 5A hydrolase/precorrin-3B C17-methyltransferase